MAQSSPPLPVLNLIFWSPLRPKIPAFINFLYVYLKGTNLALGNIYGKYSFNILATMVVLGESKKKIRGRLTPS